ncbi:MAG: M20 family metallopeptidase [Acidobacteriia bacterium]|nr:M20 family metallopeptidase [Terriglobia bacterium]
MPRLFLQLLVPRLPEMTQTLQRLVVAESPSLEKAVADRCAQLLSSEWRQRGARVELLRSKTRGDHVRAVVEPSAGKSTGQILVLGHYDTVYGSGTLRKMPFRIRGGKAYGPGAFDMKGGIVQALFALEALQQARVRLRKRIVFLWTSDEEVGSENSEGLIQKEARRSDAALVLEPSYGPKGLLKTSRKGVGFKELIVHGKSSHAGLAPEEGVNAVHEMALQILRIAKWTDLRRGISASVNVIEGGTRTNVIPDRVRAMIDLRALTLADMRKLEKQLAALRPESRGARIEIRKGSSRAPLERKMTTALFARARHLAAQMGISLGECSVGGGSDGNITASLGVPTLDGLGAVGSGAHSADEHLLLRTMPERAALLAALLASL